MIYGFICLLWTPRFTPRSILYSLSVVGVFGFLVKLMWWSVNQDYLGIICKSLSVVFGVKSAYLLLGMRAVMKED